MSYCLNHRCYRPQNADSAQFCQSCGAKLRIGDRYRAVQLIGQGGFGRTFLARDECIPSHPLCVVKQLFPKVQTAKQLQKASQLFYQEAMRLEDLGQHVQIPKLLAHFTEGQHQYLIQTYVDGQTLEQELATTGPFNETQIRQLLVSLLPVLQFIHDRRIIHRDIKPANIIRRRLDGQLVLVDFGASKHSNPHSANRTGTVIGSAGFAAPEQVAGKAIFASDLYSLGVTCLYLLTQIPPFDLYAFAEGQWVWRQYLQTPVSDRLGTILDRMVELPSNRRYTSATSVLADLNPPSAQEATVSLLSAATSVAEARPSSTLATWACVQTLCDHANSVAAIAIHPNGKCFASSSFDRTIKLWHLGTGARLSRFEHNQPVVALAFSPDGQALISGSVDSTIKLWDLHSEQLRYTLTETGHSLVTLAIAVSPDGQAIASGSDDCKIKLWHLPTGRRLRTVKQERGITSVAISPDGQWLVSGSSDNLIRLWNCFTGDWVATLEGHRRDVNMVAISPDGQLLASGSSDHTVKLWNLKSQTLICTLAGHLDWVNAIAISPDGQLLASGSSDHTVKLWNLATAQLQTTLVGHDKAVNAIAFSPDGQTLISGSSDRTLKLWRKC